MKTCVLSCLLVLGIFACNKEDNPDPVVVEDQSFLEEFESAGEAASRGWVFTNRSIDPGSTNWGNPSTPPFPAYSWSTNPNGYLWVDYNSTTSAAGVISSWAISPVVTLQNGDRISFYTRAEIVYFNDDSTDFANRLQVRLNARNTGQEVGNGSSTGDFNTLLLDINPDYQEFLYSNWTLREASALNAYPHRWTRFEAVVSGLAGPTPGRFAFRYFVEGGGNNGRASSVGIDRVEYIGQAGQ